ncbi:MAG: TRAP transporter substrate-binding protein [Actinomycetes bacterium]
MGKTEASRLLDRRQMLALSALGAAGAACGTTAPGATGDSSMITAATYIPPSYKDLYPAFPIFMDAAKKAKSGLKFDWHHSEKLLTADQLLSGLKQGVADLIFQLSSLISATYPVLGATELPFVNSTFTEQKNALAVDGELHALLNEELGKKGLMILGHMPTSFEWIWTVDKPVRTPDDLKGLRIRTAGDVEGATVKAYGASPVAMSSAEVYQALQRGTVDGMIAYMGTVIGRSLQDVIKYGTIAPFGDYSIDAVVTTEWFDKQPKATQDALTEAGKVYTEQGTAKMRKVHLDSYLPKIEQAGVELYEPKGAELEVFRKAAMPVHDTWRGWVGNEALADKALDLVSG